MVKVLTIGPRIGQRRLLLIVLILVIAALFLSAYEGNCMTNTSNVYEFMLAVRRPLTVDELALQLKLTKTQIRTALRCLQRYKDLVEPVHALKFGQYQMREGTKQQWRLKK